ncbi:germin-like protein 9-3 [Tanacetum coccineum]
MRAPVNAPFPKSLKESKAAMAEFFARNGQSVSYAVPLFPNGTHPRASELFVLMDSLQVGFADITSLALSAFGSANAGTVSVPNSVLNTSIDDHVLALFFETDVATIKMIKSKLSG